MSASKKSACAHIDRWPFVAELRRPLKHVFHYRRRFARSDKADLTGGVTLAIDFKSALLETAYSDLNKFFLEAGIARNGPYRITFEKATDLCFEEYRIAVKKHDCLIQAADTEGMRRAIFFWRTCLPRRTDGFCVSAAWHASHG